jgi:hypothetical protein
METMARFVMDGRCAGRWIHRNLALSAIEYCRDRESILVGNSQPVQVAVGGLNFGQLWFWGKATPPGAFQRPAALCFHGDG